MSLGLGFSDRIYIAMMILHPPRRCCGNPHFRAYARGAREEEESAKLQMVEADDKAQDVFQPNYSHGPGHGHDVEFVP